MIRGKAHKELAIFGFFIVRGNDFFNKKRKSCKIILHLWSYGTYFLAMNTIDKKREKVSSMFDSIAGRYDFLNHLLSGGIDFYWRDQLVEQVKKLNKNSLDLLDIATGTGDVIFALEKKISHLGKIYGVDISDNMLDVARQKAEKKNLHRRISFENGDVTGLRFENDSFDIASISFGIRNVEKIDKAFTEVYRVLRDNGRFYILEFSLPQDLLFKPVYLFYLRNVLPKIGRIVSKDSHAYTYLNKTIETFPYGNKLAVRIKEAGFKKVIIHPLTFGIATLYVCHK